MIRVIIPARYASQRLPGKVLLPIAGHTMLYHVYQAALQAGADSVVIAADHPAVVAEAEKIGAPVCWTAASHHNGTERITAAAEALGYADEDLIVSLQADEPALPPGLIGELAACLQAHPAAPMASVCQPFSDVRTLHDSHVVKVVLNQQGEAIYFSRAPVPHDREGETIGPEKLEGERASLYYHHIGLYAYRLGFLKQYVRWPVCDLEVLERLEQLRVLFHGHRIQMLITQTPIPGGVDTEADWIKMRQFFGEQVG